MIWISIRSNVIMFISFTFNLNDSNASNAKKDELNQCHRKIGLFCARLTISVSCYMSHVYKNNAKRCQALLLLNRLAIEPNNKSEARQEKYKHSLRTTMPCYGVVAVKSIELSTSIHTWMGQLSICAFLPSAALSQMSIQGKTSNHFRNIWLAGWLGRSVGQSVWIWFHFWQLLSEPLWSSIWVAFLSFASSFINDQTEFDQYVRYRHCLHNCSDNDFQFLWWGKYRSLVFRVVMFENIYKLLRSISRSHPFWLFIWFEIINLHKRLTPSTSLFPPLFGCMFMRWRLFSHTLEAKLLSHDIYDYQISSKSVQMPMEW